jgi:hypothetical protein
MSRPLLSTLVVVHNEEQRLDACLERLAFADEIVVVLDKCTDGSRRIAERYTTRLLEGAWEIEGERRNAGIEFCDGEWILEVDADEWITPELAQEVRLLAKEGNADIHAIPVDNYVGGHYIRHGWGGGGFGMVSYPGLFRKGVKVWGPQRVHPHLVVSGRQGAMLKNPVTHHIDDSISAMLMRLDRYTTWRARDLCDEGKPGALPNMVRKVFSRFWKCWVVRKAYREGGYGMVMGICSALYPLLAHLKATLEEMPAREARK